MCDISHYELPCEILALSQVQAEGQPFVGRDGSAVSCTEIIVDAFFASRNEPAGVCAEAGTRVNQELLFTKPIHDEEAACGCSADMFHR
jgi:hypothetical protein